MNSQRINITLPFELVRDLRLQIPTRSRSKFIAGVLKEKLDKKRNLKRALIKSLKANRKLDEQVIRDWDVTVADGLPEW